MASLTDFLAGAIGPAFQARWHRCRGDGLDGTAGERRDGTMMKRVIRLKRSYLRTAVVYLPIFSAMFVLSVLAMYLDSPPDRRFIRVLLMASIGSFLVGINVWLLLAY